MSNYSPRPLTSSPSSSPLSTHSPLTKHPLVAFNSDYHPILLVLRPIQVMPKRSFSAETASLARPATRPRLDSSSSPSDSKTAIDTTTRGSSNLSASCLEMKSSLEHHGPSPVELWICSTTARDAHGRLFDQIFVATLVILWRQGPPIEYIYRPAARRIYGRCSSAATHEQPAQKISLGHTQMTRDEWNGHISRSFVAHKPRADKWRLHAFQTNIVTNQMTNLLGFGDIPGHILLQPALFEVTRWSAPHEARWREHLPHPTMRPSLNPAAVVPAAGPRTTVAELVALDAFQPTVHLPHAPRCQRRYSLTGTSTFSVHVPITSTCRKRSNSDGTLQTSAELAHPTLRLAPLRKLFYHPSTLRQLLAIVAHYPIAAICYVDGTPSFRSSDVLYWFVADAVYFTWLSGGTTAFAFVDCNKVHTYTGPTPAIQIFVHGKPKCGARHFVDLKQVASTMRTIIKEAMVWHPHCSYERARCWYSSLVKQSPVHLFVKRPRFKRLFCQIWHLSRQMKDPTVTWRCREVLLWTVRVLLKPRSDHLPQVCNLSEVALRAWITLNELYMGYFPVAAQFPMLDLVRYAFAGTPSGPGVSLAVPCWTLLISALESCWMAWKSESHGVGFVCAADELNGQRSLASVARSTMVVYGRLLANAMGLAPRQPRKELCRLCLRFLRQILRPSRGSTRRRTNVQDTQLQRACLAAAHGYLKCAAVPWAALLMRHTSETSDPYAEGRAMVLGAEQTAEGLSELSEALIGGQIEWLGGYREDGEKKVSRVAIETLRWNIVLCIRAVYGIEGFEVVAKKARVLKGCDRLDSIATLIREHASDDIPDVMQADTLRMMCRLRHLWQTGK